MPIKHENKAYSIKKHKLKLNQPKEEDSQKMRQKKRSIMGEPINLFVELLVLVDSSIYQNQKEYIQTNDTNLIFQNMQIYYSHFFNGVNLQFQNSLTNDIDLQISIKLKDFIYVVSLRFILFKFFSIR
jgi:hypothetical protein